MFEQERRRIVDGLDDEVVQVSHIGSTAIPGIKAKPTIDMLIVVRDISRQASLEEVMMRLGYSARGENGIPGRLYFSKGTEKKHSHHAHMFGDGHPEIQRHMDFVAYLVTHAEDARRYNDLKESLARRFPTDTDSYTEGKSELIREIDERAKLWRQGRSGSVNSQT